MKVSIVCHGNIARSQVLHHYLAEHATMASLPLALFSCGTAPPDAYPDAERLLAEVQSELTRRGVQASVKRNVMDKDALDRLAESDLILVADRNRLNEVKERLENRHPSGKIMLFYEFIGEGRKDFVDTYDPLLGAQDPERFARCFDELERIAKLTINKIREEIHE